MLVVRPLNVYFSYKSHAVHVDQIVVVLQSRGHNFKIFQVPYSILAVTQDHAFLVSLIMS